MTQETLLLNIFFAYFFDLGDYLAVFTALGLTATLLMGFIKYFIRHA